MVVDDDPTLVESVETALGREMGEIRCCSRVAAVAGMLDGWVPDLLLLDVVLPDGDAFDVMDLLDQREPMPQVIAISGMATAPESFDLAQRGVGAYLSKPFTMDELRQAIEQVSSQPAELRGSLRSLVGKRPLRDVEQEVRTTMVKEALARSGGRRSGAARLLKISRQVVQHILRGWKS